MTTAAAMNGRENTIMKTTDKLTLDFLNAADCKFEHNKNGFLIMSIAGQSKGRVKLSRSYPYTLPNEYICVSTLDDNEVGIIRDLNALDESSCTEAKKELEARYYCPVITEIKSVKEKMGHFYFEAKLGDREKTFTVRDITQNIRFAGEDTLLIFDMDGNRYTIQSYSGIPQKSRRLLEPYLY